MKNIQLLNIDGWLYFPATESNDEPEILLCVYSAGDCDTIQWPMVPGEYSDDSVADIEQRLAKALFDERECNPDFPYDAKILLPNGEVFDFDATVA